MNTQEINLAIAEILGYKTRVYNGIVQVWKDDPAWDGDWYSFGDYTTNKALCWDFMEKLGEAGWYYRKENRSHIWERNVCLFTNESLLLATCEAFIEEFKK